MNSETAVQLNNEQAPSRKIRRLFIGVALLASIGMCILTAHLLYNYWNVASNEDYTISFTRDYTLSNNEPESGVYLGAYVLQNSTIEFSMKKFNELAKRNHITFFKYVGYGKPFPTSWVEHVKSIGGFPHIAFEPNNGLDEVTDSDYLRQFARAAKDSQVPIMLRYASEMNGTWTNYSQDPVKYKEKWKLIHRVMEEEAPNVAMVWTVLAMPEEEIMKFYPGDEFVDWVGVNVYSVKYHNNHKYEKADFEDPLDLLNYVYNQFSHSKPIQISEFGVTHYNTTDERNDDAFAIKNINRLYTELPLKYPRIKAVYYFDVNNLTEYNQARRINDYSITTVPELVNTYADSIDVPHYLSEFGTSREGESIEETFTYRGQLFEASDTIYVNEEFFTNYVQASIQSSSGQRVTVAQGEQSVTVNSKSKRVGAGFKTKIILNKFRTVEGLPLKETLEALGYMVSVDEDAKMITIGPKH